MSLPLKSEISNLINSSIITINNIIVNNAKGIFFIILYIKLPPEHTITKFI
jgi:hypothetical protein